jgi:nucleoid-associated protein YgaU
MRRRKKDATFGMVLTVGVLVAGGMYFGRSLTEDKRETEGVFISMPDPENMQQTLIEEDVPAPTRMDTPEPVRTKVVVNTPTAEPEVTTVTTHTVAPDDTLEKIARKYYGSIAPKHWRHICAANDGLNPHSLRIGMKLVIPPKLTDAPAAEDAPAAAAASAGRHHVVKPRERLWDISKHYYGKGSLYKKILDANPDVNPNRLKPGTKLLIP